LCHGLSYNAGVVHKMFLKWERDNRTGARLEVSSYILLRWSWEYKEYLGVGRLIDDLLNVGCNTCQDIAWLYTDIRAVNLRLNLGPFYSDCTRPTIPFTPTLLVSNPGAFSKLLFGI
jgi:hypothetical protein